MNPFSSDGAEPTTAQPASTRALSRRGLLAGAAAAGAAASLARVPFARATGPGEPPKPRTSPASPFFEEPALNYEVLSVVAAAAYGASEVGEVLAAFDRIKGKKERL